MNDEYFKEKLQELLYLFDEDGCFEKQPIIEFFKTMFATGRAYQANLNREAVENLEVYCYDCRKKTIKAEDALAALYAAAKEDA